MKQNYVKRVLAIAMATLMATGLLAGCSSEEGKSPSGESGSAAAAPEAAASGDTIELTFWTLSTRQEAFEPMTEAFNSSQDRIHVTCAFYDTDGIKDACKVAAQSGTLPNMWFNWGGSLGGYYAEHDLTYDLTSYAEKNGWNDKYNAGALSLCTLNEQLCGYPTSYNVLGMYYRKDIFEQYGIEVPSTFAEFEAACATLKENGITPISTAGLYGWHVMRVLEQFIEYYAGAEEHDTMNEFQTSWDNEAVIKGLIKYQEFCEKGYFPEGFLTADPNDTLMALGSGTAAMDIQGQWYDGMINQDGLDMDLFGWFPFPNETGRMSAFAEMTQFNANNTEEQIDACVEFMDYCYSQENVDQYEEYYNLPLPTVDAKMPEGQPHVEEMINNSAEHGTFTITDQAFPTEVADVLFNAQDAIGNKTMTPEEAAKNIQAAIEAYTSK